MVRLFRISGFAAFIAMMFLNAFVDLGHKIVIQNTVFRTFDGATQVTLTAILNGLILLPFVLLFTASGYCADRYAKPRVMRIAAGVAVVLTLLITAFYALGWFWAAFGITLLLGVQAAIYSPAKYGFIKELVGPTQLTSANGLVQAVSTIAILAGIFVFSILFETHLVGSTATTPEAVLPELTTLGYWLVLCSLVEFGLAFTLPATPAANPGLRLEAAHYWRAGYLRDNLRSLGRQPTVLMSIAGLAVFWAIAQVVVAVYPEFAKSTLGLHNTVVVQGLLACSGIGVVLGALLAGASSRDHIELGLVPIGAAGVAASLLMIPLLPSTGLQVAAFIAFGTFGGLFVIPLNALIQYHAAEAELGTVLAGSNFIQNVGMLALLGVTAGVSSLGLGSTGIFLGLTLIALVGAVLTVQRLPQVLVRFIAGMVISQRYRIEVVGFERIPRQGGVLLLGNHISWIDWAIVQIASPRPIRFVMDRRIYERWYLRSFLDAFGVIPIGDSGIRTTLAAVRDCLNRGEVVALFPEGGISRTGHLGEFKRGFEAAAQRAQGVIVPFYLRGLWGSSFSRANARLRLIRSRGLRRRIICAFGEPQPMSLPAEQLKRRVFELSIEAWQRHTRQLGTVPAAFITTAKRMGGDMALADTLSGGLSGWRVLTGVILIARFMRRLNREQNVGLLLPTTNGGAIANLAALLCGKTVVNLNYTASVEAVQQAIAAAGLRTVFTSSRFLDRLQQRGVDGAALLAGTEVHCLEDFAGQISKLRRLLTLLQVVLLPGAVLKMLYLTKVTQDSTAAILFSSGSEGSPKGVMLSHRNIMGNIQQISDMMNTEEQDVVMATLPLFHAFGLTGTVLMPLVEGIPAVCHPDPTDVVNIAKAVAEYRGTVLLGTSSFFRLYVRNTRIHPLMFQSLRLVVAGAEKLSPEVRESFRAKFGKEIYEGYGSTETTPVASVNIPDQLDTTEWKVQVGCKYGTVGMPVPGASFRVVDPDTLRDLPLGEDGLVLIGGTQVMLGYLNDPERTAKAIVEEAGMRWYKSGDKGHLDADGFLTLVDRYSRFAKIAGEMVSLTAVETQVCRALNEPELELCALNFPDPKKGERIVLLVASETLVLDDLSRRLLESGMPPLSLPAEYRRVAAIPKLGSGKTDFGAARALALSLG